jgi:cell division septation protein DedD
MQRAYRLELSGRTLLLLVGLMGLTGLVVFYLGLVTGKGLRDPNQPPPPAAAASGPAQQSPDTALTFSKALTAPQAQIEGLKQDGSKAAEQTQQLIARAKQQLELEEVPAKSAAPAPVAQKPAPAVAPQPPATAASAAPTPAAAHPPAKPAVPPAPAPRAKPGPGAAAAGEEYTVQVFSSMKQQSAQEMMAELKKKGFPAFLNQFQAADRKTWYRVRVGKGSKAQAEALAERLRRESNIESPRVLKL